MAAHPLVKNTLIGLTAGYSGLRAMDLATSKLYTMASEADKEQEKRVSPGVAYNLAARDLAGDIDIQLDDKKASTVGSAFHLGLGLNTGLLYMLLRRGLGVGQVSAASTAAGALFFGIDEGANWAMGWSAPPDAYPLSTHIRGAVGHAVLGAITAITAEALSWALD
jgi:hypothetical protein